MEKRITNTPVLQYSSEFKHSRHDSLWTHGCVDRNGIVLDTTDWGSIFHYLFSDKPKGKYHEVKAIPRSKIQ